MASDDPVVRRRIVSVGQPLPAWRWRSATTRARLCPRWNERGEIYVRGEQVSGEYLGKGSQLVGDGWFPTRDGGSMDAEGYLFLEGRIDDIIVRGGENMSPGEIEDVLLEHAAVADAAVVGLPDEQWGEKVVAVVVTCKAGSEVRVAGAAAVGEGPAALVAHAGEPRVLGGAPLQRDGQAAAPQGASRADERVTRPDAEAHWSTRFARRSSACAPPTRSRSLATLTGEGVLIVDLPAADGGPIDPELLELRARASGAAGVSEHRDPGEAGLGLRGGAAAGLRRRTRGRHERARCRARADAREAAGQPRARAAAPPQRAERRPPGTGGRVHRLLDPADGARVRAAGRGRHVPRERPPWPRARRAEGARGARLNITLNRPDRHNAFALELRDGLAEGLELALCDDSIEEVVLRGNGPSFCSGGDLDEFGSFPDPVTAHAVRSTRNPGRLLAALAPRVRARVHGACVGAGEPSCRPSSPRIEADESAWFQLPELSMGLVPGAGGTVSLTKRIGRQRTAWLALTGERIDAATALDWGLVDAVVRNAG